MYFRPAEDNLSIPVVS